MRQMISAADRIKQMKSLKYKGDLDKLMQAGAEILGNPCIYIDTSYNLLTYSPQTGYDDDPIWKHLIQNKCFLPDMVEFFMQEDFVKSYAEADVVSYMRTPKLKRDRMNGKVFDKNNVQVGSVACIEWETPFDKTEEKLLEIFCEKLGEASVYNKLTDSIERVYDNSVLVRYVKGEVSIEDASVKETVANFLGGIKGNLFLGVVDITHYDETNTHLAYFRDELRKVAPQHKYFILENSIVFFAGLKHPYPILHDFGQLNEYFIKSKLYCGVSSVLKTLADAKQHYRQALTALNYGLASGKNVHIFRFDNCRVENYLYRMKLINPNCEIVSPFARAVADYDAQNLTNYTDIVYNYIMYGCNAGEAAKHLELSKEVVQKGLKFVQKKFDIDFLNGDMLIAIYMSIKMLRG